MNDRPELSLVMPAYNEEKNIRLVIERADDVARQIGLRYELIVVDDGSVDNTKVEVESCAKHNGHVKVASYDNNVGKGFVLRSGFPMLLATSLSLWTATQISTLRNWHVTLTR